MYLCTTCESRLLSLQDAQTSLASHSFALPLHCVRKQAALVAKCSNKFDISLVCTAFVLRKRSELLDGKLSFSMTLENERWNGKNGGFFYRGTSKKRLSAVLIVRFS